MVATAYRLTAGDEARIIRAISTALPFHRGSPAETEALTRIGAHAIGCSTFDLRQSELDWIGEVVADLLTTGRTDR